MQNKGTQEMESNHKSNGSDVELIKEDIRNLVQHLTNLKNDKMEEISEELEQLTSSLSGVRDQLMHKSNRGLRMASWYIQKCPMKSVLYSFGTGIVMAMLWRK